MTSSRAPVFDLRIVDPCPLPAPALTLHLPPHPPERHRQPRRVEGEANRLLCFRAHLFGPCKEQLVDEDGRCFVVRSPLAHRC